MNRIADMVLVAMLVTGFGARIIGTSIAPSGRIEWRLAGLPEDWRDRVASDPALAQLRAFVGVLETLRGVVNTSRRERM